MLRLAALFAFLFAAPAAFAQTGKIQGRVTDAATGEGLPGVNVRIEGTTQGTATDLDGNYVIIGVRPGTYVIVASYIGFNTQRVENVRVQIDLTTRIDFALREETLQGEEVVITAERPLVQRDLTATTAVVGADELEALPVENFQDVVNLQAGVVNGHFRGGRLGEVGYWVDGLPVSDVYNGGLGVAIENDMVQELQVVTGAFNAEYGQALSGIVNVVTKDGDNKFSGSLSGFAGDYLSSRDDVFPEIGEVSATNVRNLEGSLSGPVVRDRLWFFATGRYFGNDGYIGARNAFASRDVGYDNTGRLTLLNPGGSGDSSVVPLSPFEKMSGQAKLTLRLTRNLRLSANVIASQERSREGSYGLLLFPANRLHQERDARTAYAKFTHTLSNRTFYDLGITNTYSTYRQFLFDRFDDERYVDNNLSGGAGQFSTIVSGFLPGGTNNSRFSRSTDTWLVKADVTSQVGNSNLVKVGVEARRHTLEYNDDYVTVVENSVSGQREDVFLSTNGRYSYTPTEFSAYVQDKVELGGLIINAGVRFDYFDSNGDVLRDPTDPDAVFAANRFQDEECGAFVCDKYFQKAEAKWQFSPRLGVAFPITQGGVIHFSYGHFFQTPNFEYLYQNPRFQLGTGGSGLVGLFGNADLKPEQTISGEIGLKQELTRTSAIELTAYYRDIRNLTGTATAPIEIEGSGARYGLLRNSDFGFVRGVILRFDQRVGDGFFAGVDYTFQIARSNSSDPSQIYNAAAAKQELEKVIGPTDWDQRHTANVSASYSGGNWGFGVIGSVGSGSPYTPVEIPSITGRPVPSTVVFNTETKPVTYDIDLTAYRNVKVGRANVQVFTKIDNLLDTQNEYGVFGDTGRGTYSLQQGLDARNFIGNPALLDRWYRQPYFFGEPRRVVLGLTVNF